MNTYIDDNLTAKSILLSNCISCNACYNPIQHLQKIQVNLPLAIPLYYSANSLILKIQIQTIPNKKAALFSRSRFGYFN